MELYAFSPFYLISCLCVFLLLSWKLLEAGTMSDSSFYPPYGLAKVLSQRIYLLNKCLQNWIVGDTIAPQGTIKSDPFFFNTIKRYCHSIVIDSENPFPEFYLLKLKKNFFFITGIEPHGNKSYNPEALIGKKRSPFTTWGLSREILFNYFCLFPLDSIALDNVGRGTEPLGSWKSAYNFF